MMNVKIQEKDIKTLNNELEEYKQIKLKFLRNFGNYTQKQTATFWGNFYKKKLAVMLSIVLYYYNTNELKSSTNPFISLEDRQEAKKYEEMICDELSDMDINKISSDIILLEQYDQIKNMIEKMKDKYIFSQKFWYLFMEFYKRYTKEE